MLGFQNIYFGGKFRSGDQDGRRSKKCCTHFCYNILGISINHWNISIKFVLSDSYKCSFQFYTQSSIIFLARVIWVDGIVKADVVKYAMPCHASPKRARFREPTIILSAGPSIKLWLYYSNGYRIRRERVNMTVGPFF
jgi:hypothetical protein